MAFKLAQKPTFTARVDVEIPNCKGGFDSSHFFAEFRRVSLEEHTALRAILPTEYLPKLIVGWSDLIGDDNQAVDFNETNLAALLAIPNAFAAIKNTFWDAISKAPVKN